MNRVTLGVVSAGVALLLLLVLLLGVGWGGGEAAPPSQPEAHATQEMPAVVADPAPVAAPDARVEAPPPPSGLRVLVRDRERRPVVGATIEVTGEDRDLTFPPTDAEGWTRAERMPYGDVHLIARAAGVSGSAGWRWTNTIATEVVIWVNRDRELEVTVADRVGAPHVGATVGIFGGKESDFRHTSVTTETGEDGVARFQIGGREWLAANTTIRAVAMLGTDRHAADAVDWAAEGPTRITITLDRPPPPPGPVLRVRFVDKDGVAVAVKGDLGWSRIVAAGAGTWEAPVSSSKVDGTEVTIRRLLDGDRIRLTLTEEGHLASERELTLPAGALVQEVMLPRGAVAPRLEIPIVDGNGRPVTAGSFVVTVLLTNGGYEHESTVSPDAAGLLTLSLADARAGKVEVAEPRDAGRLHWPEAKRLARPYRTTAGREPPPNPPLAVLPFAQPVPGDVIRLPAVTVPDLAPRIHGIVVDGVGKPVAGMRIRVTTTTQPEPQPFADFETQSDAEGRFAIRATALPDEVFVGGRRPLGFCTPVRVHPSSEPVTLRLLPTGAITMDLRAAERPTLPEELARKLRARIDLRIDEGALADGTWMFFRKRSPVFDAGYRDRWGAYLWMPEPAAECELLDLLPGEYRVLGCIGENTVLDLPGVIVRSGETTRPPTAQGVTIGAGIEANCVRVRDGEGRPIEKVRVWLMVPEWKTKLDHPTWQDTDAKGEAWFIVPRGALAAIELTKEGLAPVKVAAVGLPAELTMGTGTSVDFVITGYRTVAADSRAIAVGCVAYDATPPESPIQAIGTMRMFRHPQANLDAGGRASVPNLTPGRYRLWLGAVPPVMSKRGATFVLLGDREITARDPAHLVIEHELTAAETAALLGR